MAYQTQDEKNFRKVAGVLTYVGARLLTGSGEMAGTAKEYVDEFVGLTDGEDGDMDSISSRMSNIISKSWELVCDEYKLPIGCKKELAAYNVATGSDGWDSIDAIKLKIIQTCNRNGVHGNRYHAAEMAGKLLSNIVKKMEDDTYFKTNETLLAILNDTSDIREKVHDIWLKLYGGEDNRRTLYTKLMLRFENQTAEHPSIKMMTPDPLLFPKGLLAIDDSARMAAEKDKEPLSVKDIILNSWKSEEHKHILLIGEGGIGKTVTMLMLPEEEWFIPYKIPVLYIPLYELNEKTIEGNLNRYLESYYRNELNGILELADSPWESHPNLLLLLDGFNEIPMDYRGTAETTIRKWMGKPGVQIVTTSRFGFSLRKRFIEYTLKPLTNTAVKNYLLNAGLEEANLPTETDPVWKILNIPLMLTIYTQVERVKQISEEDEISILLEWKEPDNSAHIIWNYLQKELYRCAEKRDTSTTVMQYGIALLAIVPFVCNEMAKTMKFSLKRTEFIEIVEKAIEWYSARENCLHIQIHDLFEKYSSGKRIDLPVIGEAQDYIRILSEDVVLFQMKESKNLKGAYERTYSLCHQNFRDVLAAVFICTCAINAFNTDSDYVEEILLSADFYVKNFIAEYMKPEDGNANELEILWEQHRIMGPDNGRLTWVLMDLIGRQRGYDYHDLDFSGLDLSKVNLYSLLSKKLDKCPLPGKRENFEQTKISLRSLLPIGRQMLNSVSYSPDGRQLACGSSFGTVCIWDVESGESHVLEGHKGPVYSVSYRADGRQLASGSDDGTVRIWDVESGESRVLEGHKGRVKSVSYRADGRQLASGSDDGTVRIWDVKSGKSRVLEDHEEPVNSVSYRADGKQLACGSSSGKVRIWDVKSGKSRVLEGHEGPVYSVSYRANGRQLACGSSFGKVRIWDVESGESHVLEGHKGRVESVSYSPDGRQLACGSFGGTVRIWDVESGESRVLEGHVGPVYGVSYRADGRQLASGSYDGTVRIWDIESGESRIPVGGHEVGIKSVSYRMDGRQLACGSYDGTVRIWDVESGKSRVLEGHEGWVESVGYSPDRHHLASGSVDGTVRIWDVERGKSHVLKGHEGSIYSVSYSPDGQQLACGSWNGTVCIWDVKRGKSCVLGGHEREIYGVRYSPDGRQLACGSWNGTVRIWDVKSGKNHVLEGHKGSIHGVSYSPDGRQLASGSYDGTVRIWDIESGKSRVLENYGREINCVSYSPDGRQLACGSLDGTVRIWDIESGESRVLEDNEDPVYGVSYSPDGRQLASGSNDGTVRIRDIESGEVEKQFSIFPRLNLCGANFQLAIINEEDKKKLKAAGAIV